MTVEVECDSPEDGEITLAVVEDGVLCLGDRSAVGRYIEKLQSVSEKSLADLGVTTQSLADVGATASALAALHAASGTYFRMSPSALEAFKTHDLVPGAPGYFKGVVRGGAGHWAANLDFQQVALGAQTALSVQVALATASLRVAIKDVQRAVERVEQKMEYLAALVKANQIGGVIGRHRFLENLVRQLDATGGLPATNWETVAGLGPDLEADVARLRKFLRLRVDLLDTAKPAKQRAGQLRQTADDSHLGEVLQLLVVAEDSIYLWQRLLIERARTAEPEHLNTIVGSAQQQLREHLEFDGKLLADLQRALVRMATLRPLEVHRVRSRNNMKDDLERLRKEIDAFVESRRMQVISWDPLEQPTVKEARDEIGRRSAALAYAARDSGTKAIETAGRQARRAGDVIEQQIQRTGEALDHGTRPARDVLAKAKRNRAK